MKYHIIRPDEIVALKGLTAHFSFNEETKMIQDVLEITSSNGSIWEDGKCVTKNQVERYDIFQKLGQKRPSINGMSMSNLYVYEIDKYREQLFWNHSYYGIFGTFLLKEAARYGGNYSSDTVSRHGGVRKVLPKKIITLNKFYGKGLIGTQGVCFEKSVIIGIVKPLPNCNDEILITSKVSEFLDVPLVSLTECRDAMKKVMKAHSLTPYKMAKTDDSEFYRISYYSDVRKALLSYDDTLDKDIKERYENR